LVAWTSSNDGVSYASLDNGKWVGQSGRLGIGSSDRPALISTGNDSTLIMMAWKGAQGDGGIYYGSMINPQVGIPTGPGAVMIKSNLDGNVIDIQGNSTQAGAKLDAFPPKVGTPSLDMATQFAANQTWEVLRDPAGSTHYIIKNPATGHCIDIREKSLKPGAALDVWPAQSNDNQNQLWDFLPDPFGSGSCFIQNPQTGYVIEIADGSSAAMASLVVNPRRLFGNNHQLWSAVDELFSAVALPSLIMAPAPTPALSSFGSNNQYVLLAPNQSTNLTSVTVTIDIIEDLIADSFSIQINGQRTGSWECDRHEMGRPMVPVRATDAEQQPTVVESGLARTRPGSEGRSLGVTAGELGADAATPEQYGSSGDADRP
jgi:Ricin-type beta-trefoil lectin domain-like